MFGLTPYRKNQNGVTYDPFREMRDVERRLFGDPFDGFFTGRELATFRTDVRDQGDKYLVECDLPGFAKEDIHLDIEGDTLTIKAERHSEYEDKEKQEGYLRCERTYGEYSRSFDVSEIERDGIKAKLDNGVLTLTLPKKQTKPVEKQSLPIE
ncbi:MAG: Hsp20/alpha crystallin family protein [Clostridia bacterium]|nr:Hsp20/alpha crystallin family protein [Clostridia bacterium]